MSQTDQIEDIQRVETPSNPEPEVEKVVITVPAKVKRAFVSTVELVRSLFTGEIVLNPTISKGYDYLFYMALLFLVSIVALFSSLHMQIRENRMAEEVRLLNERALRSEEQRLKATTHSAIVSELKKRNIPLYDAFEPVTIIPKDSKKRR